MSDDDGPQMGHVDGNTASLGREELTKRFATLPTPLMKLFFNTGRAATTVSSLEANALSCEDLLLSRCVSEGGHDVWWTP